MENVLLDRSSGSFESFPRRDVAYYGAGCHPGPGARPRGAYGYMPTYCPQYHHFQKGGAWSSAPPRARATRPQIYSSPSLPLLPSNQPPLLPLPPTAPQYVPYPPPPTPPRGVMIRPAAMTAANVVPAPASRQGQGDRRRRRPARPPPEQARAQKKTRPPPSSLPLPTFSLVGKAASSPPRGKLVGPAAAAAPFCNAEVANADGLRRLLRL